MFDTAVLGEQDTPPDRSEWFLAAASETDPHRSLRGFVAGTGAIIARVAPLIRVVSTAAAGPTTATSPGPPTP